MLVEEFLKRFCSNYLQKSPATATVQYFYHYNFHYYHKMHIYCLIILLTVIWQKTSYELRAASYELQVESLKARVKIRKCESNSNPRVQESLNQ